MGVICTKIHLEANVHKFIVHCCPVSLTATVLKTNLIALFFFDREAYYFGWNHIWSGEYDITNNTKTTIWNIQEKYKCASDNKIITNINRKTLRSINSLGTHNQCEKQFFLLLSATNSFGSIANVAIKKFWNLLISVGKAMLKS